MLLLCEIRRRGAREFPDTLERSLHGCVADCFAASQRANNADSPALKRVCGFIRADRAAMLRAASGHAPLPHYAENNP
jgi:hypothetical protein